MTETRSKSPAIGKLFGSTKITWILLFIAMVSLTLSVGYYKKSLNAEGATVELEWPKSTAKAVVLDLADQGVAKQLVQPDKVRAKISYSNKGDNPIADLQVQTGELSTISQITANSSAFDKQTGTLNQLLNPGNKLSLTLSIDLPPGASDAHEVYAGELRFVGTEKSTSYGTVSIRIINSRLPATDPGKENRSNQSDTGSEHRGGHNH
ncbi:hypothetical protein [Heliophilum fasciatum]|uniref:Uncharacterized protein n=1 Tax=Heliophilum fasciatum TaxID=35700 RepID=A0A4R2RZQ5_9FIRM|nr:hypothetical protein [Heliophilum fasciatum]MCW2276603.1 hypothetical protein [Heliophilum fasciatum]TCP69014.1 hypothetical protein EDD73_101182 [Heliophilum fasciatum]